MDLHGTLHKLAAGEDLKIAALGDSLTYGWMVEKGYLAHLKDLLMIHYPRSVVSIINRGIPGDTAAGGLHRLQRDVLDQYPDTVFIQFGLNDAFSGCSVKEYAQNILGIIGGIKQNISAEILLMTSSALEGRDRQLAGKYYAALQKIAADENIPIALVHAYWEKKIAEGTAFEDLVQYDRVHPTAEGYRLMAEAIMQLLEQKS